MLEDLLSSLLKVVLSGAFGYLLNTVKNYKKRDKNQEEALKCLLRSTITSKYFVYTELGCIPDYEKENINYMNEQYKAMGGNSYVKQIVSEINALPIGHPHHIERDVDNWHLFNFMVKYALFRG